MIDQLRKNIDTEIDMLREVTSYSSLLESSSPTERKILLATLESLQSSMKLINNSIPGLLSTITLAKKLPGDADTSLENVNFKDVAVVLRAEDKERFFKELSITEDALKKIKKLTTVKAKIKKDEGTGSRAYIKFSNKFFRKYSERLIAKGYFKALSVNIQKANFDLLLESYVSSMLMTSFLSIFAGITLVILALVLDFSFASVPPITLADGGYADALLKTFWIPFVLPMAVFGFMYMYPSTEKSTIEHKIDQELPFAVIHMSAISGAGIEPTNIFKIIALSKEYPHLRKEIRKVLNQINLYGYDLVTALNNISRATPSVKLAELFAGLSTTIHSGGELPVFFEKRAETLLLNYRLEREKFTKVAETFMDIYITIAIAAPMIMLLILIMISLSNFDIGLTPTAMTGLVVAAVSVLNFFFLGMLHLKTPSY